MRVNRAKFIRKYLRFFKIVYGVGGPYNILLDGNFIHAAVKVKMDIRERLEKLFQGEDIKIFVLKSVIEELKSVGEKAKPALEFAQKFCEEVDDLSLRGNSPEERLKSMLVARHRDWLEKNDMKSRRYIVATQDKDLRNGLGHVPGVPLIYLNKVTLVLEPPSQTSKEFNKEIERSKVALSSQESEIVQVASKKLKGSNVITSNGSSSTASATATPGVSSAAGLATSAAEKEREEEHKERKKRKAQAANPLSNIKPSEESNKSKKRKLDQYRRRG